MTAVALAAWLTLCGAYHGWNDDVRQDTSPAYATGYEWGEHERMTGDPMDDTLYDLLQDVCTWDVH